MVPTRRPFAVEYGGEVATPPSPTALTCRTVALTNRVRGSTLQGCFAVLEGSAQGVNRAAAVLQEAFGEKSAGERLARGTEGAYLATVCETLGFDGIELRSMAVAIHIARRIAAAVRGGAGIYRYHSPATHAEELGDAETPGRVHTVELEPVAGDCVILVSPSVRQEVQPEEMRIADDFPVSDSAAWLSALATSRSNTSSGALLIAFPDVRARAQQPSGPRSRRRAWTVAGLAAALIALIATGLAITLVRHGGDTLGAPYHLRVVSASGSQVSLGWTPVSGAGFYRVRIAGRIITTGSAIVTVAGLDPATPYRWSVEAANGTKHGPASSTALVVSAAATPLRPAQVYRTNGRTRIQICWGRRFAAQQYELYAARPRKPLHKTVRLAATTAGPRGERCTRIAVHNTGQVAWRVRPLTPGHTQEWSRWQYFEAKRA